MSCVLSRYLQQRSCVFRAGKCSSSCPQPFFDLSVEPQPPWLGSRVLSVQHAGCGWLWTPTFLTGPKCCTIFYKVVIVAVSLVTNSKLLILIVFSYNQIIIFMFKWLLHCVSSHGLFWCWESVSLWTNIFTVNVKRKNKTTPSYFLFIQFFLFLFLPSQLLLLLHLRQGFGLQLCRVSLQSAAQKVFGVGFQWSFTKSEVYSVWQMFAGLSF